MPGLSVAVAKDGEVLLSGAYGVAQEGGASLLPNHLFRIASHSKTFAALTVGCLMEEGKIRLDDRLADFLPWLMENPNPDVARITVRQCLSHASGSIRDGEEPTFWGLYRAFPDQNELTNHYRSQPLTIDQDTRLKYSNFAYGLLGLAIEKITGQAYNDVVRDRVLDPLDVTGIGPEYDPAAGDYVTGHVKPFSDQPVTSVSPAIDTRALSPATGFYATASSLALVYSKVFGAEKALLPERVLRQLTQIQWTLEGDPSGQSYSNGFVHKSIDGHKLFGHSGGFPGQLSDSLLDPTLGLVVSVLTNSADTRPTYLSNGVWKILARFKKDWRPENAATDHAGRFYNNWGAVFVLPLGDCTLVGSLAAPDPFLGAPEYARKENDRFGCVKDVGFGQFGEDMVYHRRADGSVDHITLGGMPFLSREAMEKRLSEIAAGGSVAD